MESDTGLKNFPVEPFSSMFEKWRSLATKKIIFLDCKNFKQIFLKKKPLDRIERP